MNTAAQHGDMAEKNTRFNASASLRLALFYSWRHAKEKASLFSSLLSVLGAFVVKSFSICVANQ
jgi:hypothetical protein